MENQIPQNIEKPKKVYWKFVAGFLAVIIGVFVLVNGGFWLWQKYRYWQDEKTVQKAEEGIRKWQRENYEHAMADTYGGKTPQETLQMYINAVEKGDYELASKYFIGDYQEEWKNNLIEIDKAKKINIFLNPLKEIIKNFNGYFSSDKKIYTIEKPIFVEFKIYPNGIWKIIEI